RAPMQELGILCQNGTLFHIAEQKRGRNPQLGGQAERDDQMLRKEQNDLLTQTGPDTPMGRLFRLCWHPILNAWERPENDGPPVRVKIMGERLLVFRDSSGKLGLIDEFCAHRGVSLWFGRNEEGGLRCPYHGWKYDAAGNCIEVPSEPAESGFCKK